MKGNERFGIFILGVLIGCVLVSLLMSRRDAFREASDGTWSGIAMAAGDLPALPQGVEPILHEGRLLYYSETADGGVWVVGFTDRYPFVRVAWNRADNAFDYMAADQVLILMREGVDVAALQPAIESLGVRMRMFNRRERVAVIGTVSSGPDAVPQTLAALQPFAELFEEAGPDPILFRDGERQGLFFPR